MNVSFIRCANAKAFDTARLNNQLVEGALYFLTIKEDPLILSIVRVDSTNPNGYEVILGNSIASAPTLGSNGRSLQYYDAGGNSRSIDLSGLTIGDKTIDDDLPGYPETGMPVLKNTDTVGEALSKLYYLNDQTQQLFSQYVEDRIGELRNMITSMFTLMGDVDPGELWAKEGVRIGMAWRATTAADYSANGDGVRLLHDVTGNIVPFVCEPGDILMVVSDRLPKTPPLTEPSTDAQGVCWTVIQNNLDLTAVMSGLTGAEDGKIVTAMSYQNGVVSATYSTILGILLSTWTALEVSGAIAAGDTLGVALHKLENRLLGLETIVSGHTDQLTWKTL